jgi:hemerythrin
MRDFLECQAFVVYLKGEHKKIHEAVGLIERELQPADSSCESGRVGASLRWLRDMLDEHFQQEDQGGCLEQAVSCVPRLSAEVAKIEKEHASIIKLLDRLIERSAESVTDDFRESFRQFAKILRIHEAAENRILQVAFGTGEFETDASPTAHGEKR